MFKKITDKNVLNVILKRWSVHMKYCNTFGYRTYTMDNRSDSTNSDTCRSANDMQGLCRNAVIPNAFRVERSEEEKMKQLKVLELELDIAYQEGKRVPPLSSMKEEHWKHVLTLFTPSARLKYYKFLWLTDIKKKSQKRRKVRKSAEALERKEQLTKENETNDHIIYGMGRTSMFMRIYDSTVNLWQNNRLTRAMLFEPKVVLDCSYDKYMTMREAAYCAKQLMLCFAENRAHDDPLDLHYCNVNLNSHCMQILKRLMPTMLNMDFPFNVHHTCFTEMFPKENIVYLTPHCRNDMGYYNPNDVYIVGAMVDKVNNEPLSLAKAKKMGLRMARFPLDRYLQWSSGSGKSLTLNQVVSILLDIKSTNDWETAFRHVPRRKIADEMRAQKSLERRAHTFNMNVKNVLLDCDQTTQTPSKGRAYALKEKLLAIEKSKDAKINP